MINVVQHAAFRNMYEISGQQDFGRLQNNTGSP